MAEEYIDVKDIKKNQQEQLEQEKKKAQKEKILKPIRFLQGNIRKAYLSYKQSQLVKEGIKEEVYHDRIKDASEKYAFGSPAYNYAQRLIREKQMAQAREKAMFAAKKKLMEKRIATIAKPNPRKYTPQFSNTLIDSMAFGVRPAMPRPVGKAIIMKGKKKGKLKMIKHNINSISQQQRDRELVNKIMRM